MGTIVLFTKTVYGEQLKVEPSLTTLFPLWLYLLCTYWILFRCPLPLAVYDDLICVLPLCNGLALCLHHHGVQEGRLCLQPLPGDLIWGAHYQLSTDNIQNTLKVTTETFFLIFLFYREYKVQSTSTYRISTSQKYQKLSVIVGLPWSSLRVMLSKCLSFFTHHKGRYFHHFILNTIWLYCLKYHEQKGFEMFSKKTFYRVFKLKKLTSTLCFADFLWYSEAVFGVNTSSRVGAFTFR